jgi:hypothetical protein
MEFFRDPKNQIYSDFCYRLGRIMVQYENLITDDEKFETTLYISVLQSLTTNCNEYIRKMTNSERRNSIFKKNYSCANWGVNEGSWINNTFEEDCNMQNFITRIRNSVSHPTPIDIYSEFPSTGFGTIPDSSGSINKYRFINSPDTVNNHPKIFESKEKAEKYIKDNSLSSDIMIIENRASTKTTFLLSKNNESFARISIIELTIPELSLFVKSLANYLAQPIQANWDGETITQLLAA